MTVKVCETGAAQLTKCSGLRAKGEAWRDGGGAEQQKLPMLASQCGYVMRARDTDTHTHTHSQTHTRGQAWPHG